MNALPAGLNRVVAFLVAVAMIVVGAAAIAWELKVTWVRDRIADIDASWFDRAPDAGWWVYVLAGIAVGGIVIGFLLLSVNARPRKIGDVELPGSDNSGTLAVSPGKIANAVADDLAHHRLVTSTRSKAVDDRKRRLLEITVIADPKTSFDDLLPVVENAQRQIRGALPGSDLRARILIHLEKSKGSPQRVD